ncbi:MAG: hypothetical protein ACSHX6_08315 [Akkermansiaceae bacterium]
MNKLLITLTLTLLTSISLHAQTIRVLAWDQNIAKRKLSIAHEQKSQPIKGMHHLARSKAITLPAESQKLRVVSKDRLAKDGKPLSIALTIPEAIQQPLLIILPDEEAPIGIKTMVVDDSTKTFTWGTLLFINSTEENLNFKYEEKNEPIPNDLKPTLINPGGKTRNMGVSITSQENPDNSTLYTAIWKQNKDLRQLIIILPAINETSARLNLKFITQNKAAVTIEK